MAIKAFRSGETSPNWSNDPWREAIGSQNDEVKLSLSLPSKGGGVTEVIILIDGVSFNELAAVMLRANAEAAIRAFGSVLAEWKATSSN